jgi:hypothetical protein
VQSIEAAIEVTVARHVRGLGVALALAGLVPVSSAAVDGDIVLASPKLAPPAVVESFDEFGSAIALLGGQPGRRGLGHQDQRDIAVQRWPLRPLPGLSG